MPLPEDSQLPLLNEALKRKLKASFGEQHLNLGPEEVCADFMKQLRADPVQQINIASIGRVPGPRLHGHVEYYRPANAPSVEEVWARLEEEVREFCSTEFIPALKDTYIEEKAARAEGVRKQAENIQQHVLLQE